MLRSVFVFILVLSGALVLPVRAEVGVQGFDGRWKMTQTCPASGRSPGLANYLILQIKDGHAIGETGTRGQPGWRSVDGQIQANGNAELSYSGLVKEPEVGPQEVAMGKPYDFLIQAHFDTTIGTGTRTKYRI